MCDCHDLGDYDLLRAEDRLYRRLRETDIVDDEIRAAHCGIKQWNNGLSCDWSVMADPQDTVRQLPNYVLEISVGRCRELGIDVRYCPHVDPNDPNYNLAHSLLFFPADVKAKRQKRELRDQFLKASTYRLLEPRPKWHQRVLTWLRSWFYPRSK